jgi:ketosteroid isomerase-like protein
MATHNTDVAAAQKVAYRQAANFMNQDLDSQLALWDDSYPNPTLLPTRQAFPFKSWPEIANYYGTHMPIMKLRRWHLAKLTVDLLSRDLAFAWALVEAETEKSSHEIHPGPDLDNGLWPGRVTWVLRRSSGKWKIIHSEDSTLDLFRAYQFWDHHKRIAHQARHVLEPILRLK